MFDKLEPRNSFLWLMVLYFGLGFAVGRWADDSPIDTAAADGSVESATDSNNSKPAPAVDPLVGTWTINGDETLVHINASGEFDEVGGKEHDLRVINSCKSAGIAIEYRGPGRWKRDGDRLVLREYRLRYADRGDGSFGDCAYSSEVLMMGHVEGDKFSLIENGRVVATARRGIHLSGRVAVGRPAVAQPVPPNAGVARQPGVVAVAPQPVAPPTVARRPVAQPAVARPQPVAPPTVARPQPVVQPAPKPVAPAKAAPASEQIWKVIVRPEDASMGQQDALLTVVFFSAFGCSTCAVFKDSPKALLEKYGKKVRVLFKHKVVPAPHPDALDASVASLAAKRQGKFWQFHDKLFTTGAIDNFSLEQAAKSLSLNMSQFKKDLKDPTLRGQALTDALTANEVGAHSMPNILVNGLRMRGAKTHENLMAHVAAVLPKAEAQWLRPPDAGKAGEKVKGFYDRMIASGKSFPQLGARTASFQTINNAAIGPPAGKAKVEVVVFEDFQCPFCSKVGPSLKSFQARFPKQVRLVFKHLPLRSIHADAQLASEAAAEAQAQGKFWEYHDLLFANQSALKRSDLDRYGAQLGLDMAKFKTALDDRTRKAAVDADFTEGGRAGASGTPSVYLNGRKYQGPRGYPPEGLEAVSRTYLGL